MQEAGLRTWTDTVANVHGRIDGHNPDSPVLMIGSHYDTVKDAGQYDGAMGILVGIAAIKALVVQVGWIPSCKIAASSNHLSESLGKVVRTSYNAWCW